MKIKFIRWQLSLSYAGIALLAALLLGAIMLAVLTRYFVTKESNYLIETAYGLGERVLYSMDDEFDGLPNEKLTAMMLKLSFYVDTQIRLMNENGKVLADSGLPQPTTDISFANKSDDDTITYAKTIYIGRAKGSPFSSWLFSIQADDLRNNLADERVIEVRSDQVIKQAYYDENRKLVGYVELSNGQPTGAKSYAAWPGAGQLLPLELYYWPLPWGCGSAAGSAPPSKA